jgi:hypothetical protein
MRPRWRPSARTRAHERACVELTLFAQRLCDVAQRLLRRHARGVRARVTCPPTHLTLSSRPTGHITHPTRAARRTRFGRASCGEMAASPPLGTTGEAAAVIDSTLLAIPAQRGSLCQLGAPWRHMH